jgi:aminopeptidase-like protein
LYSLIGGRKGTEQIEMAVLWVLNYSDNEHSLLDIARISAMPFSTIREAADALLEKGLLVRRK